MTSLLCCPICSAPLSRDERAYTCPNGHCYDIAKEGYVNLLPANRKHAKDPGDDKEMAAARTRFLDGGHYALLRSALCRLIVERAPAFCWIPAAARGTTPPACAPPCGSKTPTFRRPGWICPARP